jgi:hypothetical protein
VIHGNLGAFAAAPIRAVTIECALLVVELVAAPDGWAD